MRVLITVLALVTAPFLASVSQEPAGPRSPTGNDAVRQSGQVEDQDNDDDQQCENAEHPEARVHSRNGHGHGHHWAKGHAKQAQHEGDEACDPAPSPQPPPPASGVAEIDGMSFWDVNSNGWQDNPATEPGQAGWTIELRNALTNAVLATTLTGDGTTAPLGTYAFPGLSDGTYLVCEVVQSGWRLTLPVTPRPCSSGFGYTVVIPVGLTQVTHFLANDFGNTTP